MVENPRATGLPDGINSSSQTKWGCVSVALLFFVVGAIGFLLAAASAVGGIGSFMVAKFFDFAPIACLSAGVVFGGIAAGLGAIAGPPAGWLLAFIGYTESKTGRVSAAIVVGLLSPFLHFQILVVSSVIGAIGGGFVFNACEPFQAAIYIAIGAPLVGFVLGAGTGTPPGPDSPA